MTYQSDPHSTLYTHAQSYAKRPAATLVDRVPGLSILLALVFCLAGAVAFPNVLLSIAAGLALYVVIRFIVVALASVRGLRKITAWEKVNWCERYTELTNIAPAVYNQQVQSVRTDSPLHNKPDVIYPTAISPPQCLESGLKKLIRRLLLPLSTQWRGGWGVRSGKKVPSPLACSSGFGADYGVDVNAVLPWDSTHHLVIIPNYRESLLVLRKSLDHLADSRESHRMTIVLAMEAGEAVAAQKADQLMAEYSGHFANILYTLHPNNIPGEMRCKSANQAWALHHARHKLVDHFGYDPAHIIVTTMDADTLWHPQYFSALTYQFATDPARYKTFWQAPIRYHGNIYDVNPVMRLVNVYTTATELAYLKAAWWQSLPISSYSISLALLEAVGGWDTDVIADEWHMYIKAFFARSGCIRLTPIYLPFLATVVTGDTLWATLKKRYKQSLRHAWGSKEISYTIEQMLRHPQVPSFRSLSILASVWHDLFLSSAGWIIVTLGGQLPLLLQPAVRERGFTDFWHFPPFVILQLVGVVMLALGIIMLVIDIRLRPPRPHPTTRKEQIQSILGFILLPVFGILFIVVPVFHAQLQLLLGKHLTFQVTEKG